MRVALLLLVALGATAIRVNESVEANPIRRVVTMLQKMQEKVKAEGEAEKKLFDKFMCFCNGNTKEMSAAATAAKEKIAQLNAQIEEDTAKKTSTDQELVQHKEDREAAKQAVAKATSIREKERADFEKESGDQKANIDAVNKSIKVLSKGMGASALVQAGNGMMLARLRKSAMTLSSLTSYERDNVMSFLSTKGPYGDFQPSSGEIVGILKTMKDEMDKDLGGAVSAEEAAQKNYDELVASKQAEISAASESIEKKQVRSGELAVSIVEGKNDKENTAAELGDNEKFMANLSQSCDDKAKEWDVRVKTRNEEQLALSEVIQMLNNDDSLEVFKTALPAPRKAAGFNFLQINRKRPIAQAYALVHAAARTLNNPRMSLLAYVLSQSNVSFGKVLKMIDDMVAHLGDEQKNDDKQLKWCNNEFNTSGDKKKDLEGQVQDLTAQIDRDAEEIKSIEEEIENLKTSISELDKSVQEATEQRKQENKEFVQTTAEVTAAKQLLEKAKNRLNKFYNPKLYKPPPARELTEEERIAQNFGEVIPTEAPEKIRGTNVNVNFAQEDTNAPPPPPETWSGDYKNKGSEHQGVVAMVDILLKDLDTQLTEGKADEENAQKAYDTLMSDSKASRAQDVKATTEKEGAKAALEGRVQESKDNRKFTGESLVETNKYIHQLHGSCDFLVENFDYRKAARGNEKDALTNAKAVLSGANY